MPENPETSYRNEQESQDIAAALEVEQLDTYLFRSKDLSIPFLARGAFGGQIISQALVSATQCVKPTHLLHVRNPFILFVFSC
jgi:acyl-CoA thioesterase